MSSTYTDWRKTDWMISGVFDHYGDVIAKADDFGTVAIAEVDLERARALEQPGRLQGPDREPPACVQRQLMRAIRQKDAACESEALVRAEPTALSSSSGFASALRSRALTLLHLSSTGLKSGGQEPHFGSHSLDEFQGGGILAGLQGCPSPRCHPGAGSVRAPVHILPQLYEPTGELLRWRL